MPFPLKNTALKEYTEQMMVHCRKLIPKDEKLIEKGIKSTYLERERERDVSTHSVFISRVS